MVTSTPSRVPAPDDLRASILQDGGHEGSAGRAEHNEHNLAPAASLFRTLTAQDWRVAISRARRTPNELALAIRRRLSS